MITLLHRVRRRLRALVHGRTLDAEHNEEVAFHIDAAAHELARAEGLAPAEARRRARCIRRRHANAGSPA